MREHLATGVTAPVKVGYIIKMFPRLSETFILNEILELEQQGLDLRIFSLKRPADSVFHPQTKYVRSPISYLPETFREGPLRLARAHLHVWRYYRRPWRHTLRNTLRRTRAGSDSGGMVAFGQACCLIREMQGIRHLHAHYANLPAKIALLVQRLTGISYSITTHAKDIFQNNPFASPKLKERMSRATFVVANSRFSAAHIRAGLDGQGEIRVVHNGLDLQSFPKRQIQPEHPLILSVGRLVEKKGFSDLVSACQILGKKGIKFRCEIVGTGILSARLKEETRSAGVGDCVRLAGPMSQQQLLERYNQAMVFALPCVQAADGDRDILPNVIKEAMAVGVPVVTTRLGGIDELIEDGICGLLVEPGNVPALAAQLESVLTSPDLRQRLTANARAVIEERFDRRTNFAHLKTWLESAAGLASAPSVQPATQLHPVYDADCVR
jgi:glycosyltransferase involved in cell wall biosynthesis